MCLHKFINKPKPVNHFLPIKPLVPRRTVDSHAFQHLVWIGGGILLMCVYLLQDSIMCDVKEDTCFDEDHGTCGECNDCSEWCDVCAMWYPADDACPLH